MHEHTVDLITAFGPVTADFSKGRLTGSDIATVSTGPGFGINRHQYSAEIFLNSPGWTEAGVHPLYDTTFADAGGRHPFPRERAAMMAAIRSAVADYAARAGTRR
jgi:hypothetical protein